MNNDYINIIRNKNGNIIGYSLEGNKISKGNNENPSDNSSFKRNNKSRQ